MSTPPQEIELPQPPFAHPDAFIGPPLPTRYSRWVKSSISYGPLGRLALSLGLFAPVVWGLMFSPIASALWLFVVYPVALRSVWKKIPVHD